MDGAFNIPYLRALIRMIKREKIDLIHSHLFGSNVYCSMAGFFCEIPVISTFHGTVDRDPQDKMVKVKFRLINLGSKYIVFVSDYLKSYFLNSTPLSKSKSVTIYNGVDCDRFAISRNGTLRRSLGYADSDVVIGSVGNIRRAKGYDILLRAAAIINKMFPQCKFLVVGEGHGNLYDELVALRSALGLEHCVQFLGFRSDTEQILSCVDLFLLPSTTEGFSISTIEAMAAGKLVIVTKSGGPEEIISHLKNGILVEPNNPEAIAEGVKHYFSDTEMRRLLALNAQQTVRERFSIESMINQYGQLYDRILRQE